MCACVRARAGRQAGSDGASSAAAMRERGAPTVHSCTWSASIVCSPVGAQGLLQHHQLRLQPSQLVAEDNVQLRHHHIIGIDVCGAGHGGGGAGRSFLLLLCCCCCAAARSLVSRGSPQVVCTANHQTIPCGQRPFRVLSGSAAVQDRIYC